MISVELFLESIVNVCVCVFYIFSEYYPLRRTINLMVIHAWRESTDDSIQSLLKPFPFPISTSEKKSGEKTPTWQHTHTHTGHRLWFVCNGKASCSAFPGWYFFGILFSAFAKRHSLLLPFPDGQPKCGGGGNRSIAVTHRGKMYSIKAAVSVSREDMGTLAGWTHLRGNFV